MRRGGPGVDLETFSTGKRSRYHVRTLLFELKKEKKI